MLTLLLNWIFIFFVTYISGWAILKLLNRFFKTEATSTVHFSIVSLTGLALLTTLANYTSLFFRINVEFALTIGIFSFLVFLLFRQSLLNSLNKIDLRSIHPITYIFGAGIIFIAFVKSAGPTEVWDEGQYFLPLIRWIEAYPAIPGTALFHDRMGYNSAFHMSNAIFSHVYFFKGGLYDLNAYIFLLINLFFLKGINNILKGNSQNQLANFFMLFAGIALYRQLLTSIDADYPHVFIGIVILLLFIKKSDEQKLRVWDEHSNVIVLLSLYLVSVKFMAVFYLIFIGFLFFFQFQKGNLSIIWKTLGFGALLILPWFVRNVILTGYLVYPVHHFDLFDVDWKVPAIMAENNYLYVSEHAKTLIERHTLYYDGAGKIPVSDWLPQWWNNHASIDISSVLTAIVFPPSLVAVMILFGSKFRKLTTEKFGHLISLGITLVFLIFWFFQYPNVRFGWAWILFLIVFTIIKWNQYILKIPFRIMQWSCLLLFSLSLARGVTKTYAESENIPQFLIFPAEVKQLENFTIKKIGHYEAVISEDMHCWGATPPCMPNYYDELEIIPRGEEITDGFKVKK